MSTYMGQKVLFETSLFGKNYFWMQDGDRVIYLAKAKPTKGFSLSPDGLKEFNEGWVPDFS